MGHRDDGIMVSSGSLRNHAGKNMFGLCGGTYLWKICVCAIAKCRGIIAVCVTRVSTITGKSAMCDKLRSIVRIEQ